MLKTQWTTVARRDDLVPESGIAVMTDHGPVAIFYLPEASPSLYAISHFDPLSKANVLARGIVGDLEGERVVASPIYKQHFILRNGRCIEQDDVTVPTYQIRLKGDEIHLEIPIKQREACAV